MKPSYSSHEDTAGSQQTAPLQDSAPPAISFEGVSKKYGTNIDRSRTYAMRDIFLPSRKNRENLRPQEVFALRDLSFSVREGETVLVLGPEGSGKTTVAKLICGITSPTTGSVTRRGKIRLVGSQSIGPTPVMRLADYALQLVMALGEESTRAAGIADKIVAECHLADWARIRLHNAPAGALKRMNYVTSVFVDADVYVFDRTMRFRDENEEVSERVEPGHHAPQGGHPRLQCPARIEPRQTRGIPAFWCDLDSFGRHRGR